MTSNGRPIYLDYQATTPTDPCVVEAMLPFFNQKFGNPHSRDHFYGWEAEDAVERARRQVAVLLGANPKEIIFTSGATESNVLALKGAAYSHREKKNRIVTTAIEHKCVLETCKRLEREGFEIVYVDVGEDGLVDPDKLGAAIDERTVMVSVIGVHNEIGVIQPLVEIGALCREAGVYFHTDCAQGVGKIPLDVEAMKIDLLSLSGHKVYGPMGIGALYVRRRPRVRLEPLFDGGGQERGIRSGTLPVPLCVGLGLACEIAADKMVDEVSRLGRFRDRLLAGLRDRITDLQVNGDIEHRIPGNLNISFPGLQIADLMSSLEGLALSSGSACTSASVEPSYVLRALGLSDDLANASVRIGIGRFTTEDQVEQAIEMIAGEVERQRTGQSASQRVPAE